jgi:hypothetical protein
MDDERQYYEQVMQEEMAFMAFCRELDFAEKNNFVQRVVIDGQVFFKPTYDIETNKTN